MSSRRKRSSSALNVNKSVSGIIEFLKKGIGFAVKSVDRGSSLLRQTKRKHYGRKHRSRKNRKH